MTTPATPQLVDTIDSFYEYVKGRVQAYNPARQFGGIVQARDWPMKEATIAAPYLLIESDSPVPYMKAVSEYQPNMLFKVSWVWMIQGDNIPANAQAANRGNKYRINMQMVQEMLVGLYPGFCLQQQYSITDDGTGHPLQVAVPYNPVQYVRWAKPRFVDKIDNQSGILFNSGAMSVSGFAPAINS